LAGKFGYFPPRGLVRWSLAFAFQAFEMTESQIEETPVVAQDTSVGPVLSDTDLQILTEARTASWRLQQYEFAYDSDVRTMSSRQTTLDFFGVMIAVIFIFLQVAVPDANVNLEWILGLTGSAVSLVVILATIWVSMAQWKTRIERMQLLSSDARELLKAYEKVIAIRPVDEAKIRKWLIDILDYDEKRKSPLVSVSPLAMKRGFQHVGKRNMGRGVVCGACNQEWNYDCNKKARWSWLPFYGCNECGV
jgi:hypothetical protein